MTQVTDKGGYKTIADLDKEKLYFTKYRKSGIWQFDLNSYEEINVIEKVKRNADFKVCSNLTYYVLKSDKLEIQKMDLITGQQHSVMPFPLNSKFKFDMKNDCQWLVFSKWTNIESDIMMLNL